MYNKQEWNNGTRLDAYRLNYIEKGIYQNSVDIEEIREQINQPIMESNNDAKAEELTEMLNELRAEFAEKFEKQKKEITALKTKITKLQKSLEE